MHLLNSPAEALLQAYSPSLSEIAYDMNDVNLHKACGVKVENTQANDVLPSQ